MSEVDTRLNLRDGATGPLASIVAAMNNTIQVMESLNAAARSADAGLNSITGNQGSIDLNTSQLNSAGASIQDVMAELNRLRTMADMNIQVDPTVNTQALQNTQDAISRSVARLRELSNTVAVDVNTQDLDRMEAAIQRAEFELTALQARAEFDMDFDTTAIERSERLIQDLTEEIQRLERAANNAEGDVDNLDDSVEDLGDEANRTGNALKNMFSGVAGALGAYFSIQAMLDGMKAFVNTADEMSNIKSRLDLVNDGLQTTKVLQDEIYNSAMRSRSSYQVTADIVSKLGQRAKDAFSNNAETIQFAENLNKMFVIAGSSQMEMYSASLQLSQALGSGVLRGEELNAVFEAAPNIIQTIADYMDVPIGKIRDMASDGLITADIVKNAMLGATNDISKQFEAMPITFAQQMTMLKNKGLVLLQPLFQRFSDFVNSDTFATLSTMAVNAMTVLAAVFAVVLNLLFWLADAVAMVGQFFMDNWSFIAPILMVIAIVLGSIVSILLVKYAVLGLIRVATLAWAAAQWIVNAAYLSNPIVWVLIAIIAVIALIVYALVVWGEQTATVIGFIVGLFAALFTYIYNNVANVANFFLAFAEFLINLFIDPVYAIKKLFYDMAMMVMNNMAAMGVQIDSVANAIGNAFVAGANMAISAINWIVDALNQIPGVDLGKVGKLSMSGSSVGNKIANMAANLEAPTSDKGVVSLPRMELGNYADNFNAASDWAYNGTMALSDSLNGLVDQAKGLVGNLGKGSEGNAGMDMESLLGNVPAFNADGLDGGSKDAKGKNPTGGKLDKVGKIDDEINIADEDLELFKEIATIKAIQNFVTLTPTVQVQTGDIQNNVDVNEVVAKIESNMANEIARSAKGVYA